VSRHAQQRCASTLTCDGSVCSCRERRIAGLKRRSPREVLVDILRALRVKNLAALFENSRVAAYALLFVLSIAGLAYGRQLWTQFRRGLLGEALAPSDALERYPGSGVAREDTPRERRSSLSTASSTVPKSNASDVDTGATSQDEDTSLGESGADAVLDVAAAVARDRRRIERHEARATVKEAGRSHVRALSDGGAPLPLEVPAAPEEEPSEEEPEGGELPQDLAALGQSGVAFLRELQSTTAGLDVRVMLALHSRLERVELHPGEILFRKGTDAGEGLYIVLQGALEVIDENLASKAESVLGDWSSSAQSTVVHANLLDLDGRKGGDTRTAIDAVSDAWCLDLEGKSSAMALAAPGLEAYQQAIVAEAAMFGGIHSQSGPSVAADGSLRVAALVEQRRKLVEAVARSGVLATFERAQTLGENALLAGHGEIRVATVRATALAPRGGAGTNTVLLRLGREDFQWAVGAFPFAVASFVLSTTARQWRVAHMALVDFLQLPEALALEREPRVRPANCRPSDDLDGWLRRADAAAWAVMLSQEVGPSSDRRSAARAAAVFEHLQSGAPWEVAAGFATPGTVAAAGDKPWSIGASVVSLRSDDSWEVEDRIDEETESDSQDQGEEEDLGIDMDLPAYESKPKLHRAPSWEDRRRSSLGGPKEAATGGVTPRDVGAATIDWATRWKLESEASLDSIAFHVRGSDAAGAPLHGASFIAGSVRRVSSTDDLFPPVEIPKGMSDSGINPEAEMECLLHAASGIVRMHPGDVLYREGADGRRVSDEPAPTALDGGSTVGSLRAGACYVLLAGRAACLVASDKQALQSANARLKPRPQRRSHRRGSRAYVPPRHDLMELPCCGSAAPGEFLPSSHRLVRHLLPGDIAGGIACVCEVPHRETVVALADCVFAVFSRRVLEAAAVCPPEFNTPEQTRSPSRQSVDSSSAPGSPTHTPLRTPTEHLLSEARQAVVVSLLLRCSKLLRPLLRLFLGSGLKRSWRHAGDVLFRAGDNCDTGMFLVVSGRVRVFPETKSSHHHKKRPAADDLPFGASGRAERDATRGATVGDLEVLAARELRESAAVCVRDTELVVFSRAAISRILASHPGVMGRFARVLAHRQLKLNSAASASSDVGAGMATSAMPFHLHSSSGGTTSGIGASVGSLSPTLDGVVGSKAVPVATIALLPAGQGGRPLRQFAAWLRTELQANSGATARVIGPDAVDEALGVGTVGKLHRVLERARVTTWLSRQEEVNDFVILVGTNHISAWSRLVAHQADVVFLIGRGVEGEDVAARAAALGAVERDAVYFASTLHPHDAGFESPRRAGGIITAGSQAVSGAVGHALEALAGAAEAASQSIAAAAIGIHAPHSVTQPGRGLEDDADAGLPPPTTQDLPAPLRPLTIAESMRLVALRPRTLARLELVLLWPEGTDIPQQTRKWLRVRKLACHHHVRESDAPWLRPAEDDDVDEESNETEEEGAPHAPHEELAEEDSLTNAVRRSLLRAQESIISLARSSSSSVNDSKAEQLLTPSWRRTTLDNGVARIARFLTGQAIGVVMGGGGARGLAHIGSLRTLVDFGIPIDYIAGTSQGAFMAASWARYLTLDGTLKAANALSARIGSLWSLLQGLTLPIVSYFDGQGFSETIQDVMGPGTQIEDLWLPYFCVTTNMTAARMDIHQTGPLWRYCRASMTVLGLLPPILDHSRKHLLVDGGYLSNLPVDVLAALAPPAGFRAIVAVDVENKETGRPLENVEDFGESLSGWYLLYRWLLASVGVGSDVRIPSISHVSINLSYISHSIRIRHLLQAAARRAGIEQEVDNYGTGSVVAPGYPLGPACETFLYVRPDVGGYGLLDYDKIREISAHGRLETDKILRQWTSDYHQLSIAGILAAPQLDARARRSSSRPLMAPSASGVNMPSMALARRQLKKSSSMKRRTESSSNMDGTLSSPSGGDLSSGRKGVAASDRTFSPSPLRHEAPSRDSPAPLYDPSPSTTRPRSASDDSSRRSV
jgi:predicted acylesterase/phospholipase RssA/CRP-like cAMP-binding protein